MQAQVSKPIFKKALRTVVEWHEDDFRTTHEEITESNRRAIDLFHKLGVEPDTLDNYGESVFGPVYELLKVLALRFPDGLTTIEAALDEAEHRTRTFDPTKVFTEEELRVMKATTDHGAARARVTTALDGPARHAKGDGSAPYVPSSHASGGTLPRRTPRTSDPDLLDRIMGPSIHLRSQGRGK